MEQNILSSLANHTRLKLLVCLSESEKNVSQLIGNCGLSQSAVSQHLEKLRSAQLVSARKEGKEMFYSLASKKVAIISSNLLSFIENYESKG